MAARREPLLWEIFLVRFQVPGARNGRGAADRIASLTHTAVASASEVATKSAPTAVLQPSTFASSFSRSQKPARNFACGMTRFKRRIR